MDNSISKILGMAAGVIWSILVIVFVILLLTGYLNYIINYILPTFIVATNSLVIICLIIFLPLSFFKKTSPFSLFAFSFLSFIAEQCNLIIALLFISFYFGYVGILLSFFLSSILNHQIILNTLVKYFNQFGLLIHSVISNFCIMFIALTTLLVHSNFQIFYALLIGICIQLITRFYSAHLEGKLQKEYNENLFKNYLEGK